MEKTATLNLRVNPDVKKNAESVLSQLGIPMATAIDMYLRQISMTGGIPFEITLPKAPASVNADFMTDEELWNKIQIGLNQMKSGKILDAEMAFAKFKEENQI